MRYSKFLSATTAKIDTIYNEVLINTVSGGGNSTISSINELDNTTSSIQKIISITDSDTLINFKNYTLSNGTTFYEILDGIITNLDTDTPNLIIYSGVSNLDLMDITLDSYTQSNITLDLSGQNIHAEILPSTYQINTEITNTNNGYPVDIQETSATAIAISSYYQPIIFKNLDTLDAITPFGVIDAGIVTTNVSFRIQNNSNVWELTFANYEFKTTINRERLEFTNVVSVFKNPDGENLESSIEDFFDDLTAGSSIAFYNEDPIILQQLTVGDIIPETKLTNVFTYNKF